MLVFCNVSSPLNLWNEFYDDLSEDVTHRYENEYGHVDKDIIKNETLILIEDKILNMGGQNLS